MKADCRKLERRGTHDSGKSIGHYASGAMINCNGANRLAKKRSSRLRMVSARKHSNGISKLTGDHSRLLQVGDCVCWEGSATDLGTVVGASWSGVTIDWDDGHTNPAQRYGAS
jgi:hypothetical protein